MKFKTLKISFKLKTLFSQSVIKTSPVSNSHLVVFLFVVFLFATILPAQVDGKTFAQYQESVKEAKILVQTLLYADKVELPAHDYLQERSALLQIRAALPPREKIEWHGAANLETDNRWLADKLNEFEKESKDSAKHAAILTEIAERLEAIEQKLNETEKSMASGNRAKDEDKQKLSEILRREEYLKPKKEEESLFQRMWRKFKEWLAEKLPRPNLPAPQQSKGFQTLSFVLQMLLYAVILGAIIFLIRRFAPFFAQKYKSRERRQRGGRVILGDRLSEDETAENLFAEAERLARMGDLRSAIRKGYVALLCDLGDRKLVRLSRHKTNRDYLRDVRGRNEIYENMNGLTVNFERNWYGAAAVEENDWNEFKNGYERIIKN